MKCELAPGIQSMSGKSGGILFKKFRKPDGSTETRAYILPRKKNGWRGYTRSTPVTEGEKRRRKIFAMSSAYASRVINDKSSDEFRMWDYRFKKTKGKYNGKKYKSLRGFIMAIDFAERKDREQYRITDDDLTLS